jgi:hypothetical protein
MIPTSLLGTSIGQMGAQSMGTPKDYVTPFFNMLKLADVQKKRKMNPWGEIFSAINGTDEDKRGRGVDYSQGQQHKSQLMQLPGQQRRQRQQIPNMGAAMIESLLGMSVGG